MSTCYFIECVETKKDKQDAQKVVRPIQDNNEELPIDKKNPEAKAKAKRVAQAKGTFKASYFVLGLTYLLFAIGHIGENLTHRKNEYRQMIKRRNSTRRRRRRRKQRSTS